MPFFSDGHFSLPAFKFIFGILAHIGMFSEVIQRLTDSVSLAGVALLVFCLIYFDEGFLPLIEKETHRYSQQRVGLVFHPLFFFSRAMQGDILAHGVWLNHTM